MVFPFPKALPLKAEDDSCKKIIVTKINLSW